MINHRKKDYLIRLLEELFKKLQQQINSKNKLSDSETVAILDEGYTFFHENFNATKEDSEENLIEKIKDIELLEQYAKLLLTEYDTTNKHEALLLKALAIVEYLENTDNTYSWERTVLKEDILHRLDNGI